MSNKGAIHTFTRVANANNGFIIVVGMETNPKLVSDWV